MKQIILATGNQNKAAELKQMLGGDYEVRTMKDIGLDIDIIEDGESYEANALIKVRAIAPYVQLDENTFIMADDSGLSVDVLDGAPGIYSARYAGEHVTYADNNEKLLKVMENVPDEQRTAAFVCAIALILPGGEEWTCRGIVKGVIARDFLGENGFGYDPLFIEAETGLSYAQMSDEQKNAISHRGKAIVMAKEKLEQY